MESLGITANGERNGALLAYIAGNIPELHLRKLLKIVYLIDERFMALRAFPLTWFAYKAWMKGPVAPEVYEVKNGAFGRYVRCTKENGSNIVRPLLASLYELRRQMDMFSPYEMQVIDSVIARHRDSTPEELTDLTHREGSLWSQVVEENAVKFENGRSEADIPLARLNGTDALRQERYDEALWNMQFQAALNKHKAQHVQAT